MLNTKLSAARNRYYLPIPYFKITIENATALCTLLLVVSGFVTTSIIRLSYPHLTTQQHDITFNENDSNLGWLIHLFNTRLSKTLENGEKIAPLLNPRLTLYFQKYEFNYVWTIWNLFYGWLGSRTSKSREPARRALTQRTGFLDPVNFGEIHYSESGKKQSYWMTVFTPTPPGPNTPSDPRQSVNMRVKYVCSVRCS